MAQLSPSLFYHCSTLVIVHYLLNSYNYNKQIFSSYQLSSPKVVQLFNFSPQLFKTYFPIFQVSQADFCPESCKRSQIYAGSIPVSRHASHDNLIDFFFDQFGGFGLVDVKRPLLPRLGFGSVCIIFESAKKATEFINSKVLPLKMSQLRKKSAE